MLILQRRIEDLSNIHHLFSFFIAISCSFFLGVAPIMSTYPEFVSFVQKFLIDYNSAEYSRISDIKSQNKKGDVVSNIAGEEFIEYKLACGHLFDRLITEYVLSEAAKSTDRDKDSSSESLSFEDVTASDAHKQVKQHGGEVNVVDRQISVVYMLVALSMAVKSNAEERVESLFKTAQIISKMKEASHNMIGGGGGGGDTVDIESKGEGSIDMNEVKVQEQGSDSIEQGRVEGDKDVEGYISVDAAHEIVNHLIHSWQVTIASSLLFNACH